MKNLKTTTLFLVFIFLLGCNKDDTSLISIDDPIGHDPNTFVENFGNEINRTFLGTVIDKNQNPIENVNITIGNFSALTDSNGVFIIQDAPVYERFGYIKAEKAGYIHGSRSIVPTEGTNKVKIMLLEEFVAGTTSSGTVETITLTNGASVALEGEYIKNDGTTYSGNVNVVIHHLDPANENMTNQMPGMLYAVNANNEERMLQTFGMLAIELRGSAGEDLNLAEGSTAEITVPLDATLLTDAPSTIPLWYFDETYGYWVEEGEATLVGNAYVGTVSHFSFWNCTPPAEFNLLTLNLFDENGNPLSNLLVTITRENSEMAYGFVNQNAFTRGIVPSNEILDINIYLARFCSDPLLYSGTIGPINTDTVVDIVIPPNINVNPVKVIGSFKTCDGVPVNHGYVQLTSDWIYLGIIDDGNFEVNILNCISDTSFSLEGFDTDNLETTGSIEYTFTNPLTNIGEIQSCNDIEEFVQYTIDGTNHVFTTNIVSANLYFPFDVDPKLDIRVEVEYGCINSFQAALNESPYIGDYGMRDLSVDGDIGFNIGSITSFECLDLIYASSSSSNIIFHLSRLGEVGEYIDINFSGDYSSGAHTVTGIIHVLRTE